MMRLFSFGICFSILMLCNGCINIAKQYPEKNYFGFSPERKDEKRESVDGAHLLVNNFRINILFAEKLMVYYRGNQRYETDFYSEYLSPPRMLITDETREWLKHSDLFESVLDKGSEIRPNYVLEGYVESLYGDISSSKGEAVAVIHFALVGLELDGNEILFKKSYRKRLPMQKASSENLAENLNGCLESILSQLEADLATYFSK